ncbi:MAG: triose-phosphate isomerase [Proteobacteria bacterium]|nr:triose-phosphate isomerase [Pseudomonadota bacterium]MBU1640968.1 triose-phosphate isomerase [Pseudomonadota bacterium]
MERTPLLAGNWKMFTTVAEATELARAIAAKPLPAGRQAMLAPSAPALHAVGNILRDTGIILASQNICWEEKGAFTGELSPLMLEEAGATMAIIGHSERRQIFAESNSLINKRLLGALKFGITPILCIGETLTERESNDTKSILEKQLRQGLAGAKIKTGNQLTIAYEPVWAIGTGQTASAAQAQDVHAFCRLLLADIFDKAIAQQIRILYGGSVNPANIDELMAQTDVDGALVGGAALKAESFLRIIHFETL